MVPLTKNMVLFKLPNLPSKFLTSIGSFLLTRLLTLIPPSASKHPALEIHIVSYCFVSAVAVADARV